MKKAQVQGQVFIYILVVIIIGLLLLFGIRGFGGIVKQGCTVQEIQFKAGLESSIRQSTAYGTVLNDQLDAPCDFQELCFVDTKSLLENPASVSSSNFFIRNSVEDGVKRNIFLVEDDGTINPNSMYVDAVLVEEPSKSICFNKENGKFSMVLEGTGKYTKIRR